MTEHLSGNRRATARDHAVITQEQHRQFNPGPFPALDFPSTALWPVTKQNRASQHYRRQQQTHHATCRLQTLKRRHFVWAPPDAPSSLPCPSLNGAAVAASTDIGLPRQWGGASESPPVAAAGFCRTPIFRGSTACCCCRLLLLYPCLKWVRNAGICNLFQQGNR